MGAIRDLVRKGRRLARQAAGRDVRARVEVRVRTEEHGSDYGGFVVCPDGLSKDSVVYSFGIGEEISFDRSMIDRYGLTVHGFDPTPKSAAWVARQAVGAGFVFHPLGLAHFDGVARFQPPANPDHVSHAIVHGESGGADGRAVEFPVRRLASIMADLGHERIDVLKMDIEGAEYEVIEQLAAERTPVAQLLVEFHHRFPEVGAEKTRRAIETLRRVGYRIFHVSASGEEYSFIRSGS